MDILRSPYYNINYRILSITGQWPYLSKKQKWIRSLLTTIFIHTLLIPMWLGVIESMDDINLALECIPSFIVYNLGFIMFCNGICMRQELITILEKIQKDWVVWSTEPEIVILKIYAKKGKLFRITYAGSFLAAVAGFLILPTWPIILDLVDPLNESRPRELLYIVDYGVDNEEYYYPIFVHSYFLSFFPFILLLNGDMMFMTCTHHVCGVLAAMGSKLTNLIKDKHYSEDDEINNRKRIDKDIIFCVKQHQELIIFIQDIHNCFAFVFLVTVTVNMIVISITGVATVIHLSHTQTALRYAGSTIAQLMHLFCLTIPCQQLIDHSVNICDSAYNSNWYLLPIHSQKLLLMIMRRSAEPFEFMVGKMYIYSMKNFATVVKTSISYFTVLSSLR